MRNIKFKKAKYDDIRIENFINGLGVKKKFAWKHIAHQNLQFIKIEKSLIVKKFISARTKTTGHKMKNN